MSISREKGRKSLIKGRFSQVDLADTPQLLLIVYLIVGQAQASLAALGFLALASLGCQTHGNTLEVVRHATFGAWREFCARASHVLVEDGRLCLFHGENRQEGCFCGQLHGDDEVAHAGEHRLHQEWQMWPCELWVETADGPDDHEGQATGVRWRARLDARCQSFEDGLAGFEAAVLILD